MHFTAAGDTAIQRVLTKYDGIDEIRNFINRGDAKFFNLETTVNKDFQKCRFLTEQNLK